MAQFLESHPQFDKTYTWTGESWTVYHKRFIKSTMFKFVSKNLQAARTNVFRRI